MRCALLGAMLGMVMGGSLTTYSTRADEVLPFFGGAGAHKCSVWLRERKSSTSILGFGMAGWLMGFISGLTENDVLVRTDAFCKDHPNAYMLEAALSVSAELSDELAKRIRAAIDKSKKAKRAP